MEVYLRISYFFLSPQHTLIPENSYEMPVFNTIHFVFIAGQVRLNA